MVCLCWLRPRPRTIPTRCKNIPVELDLLGTLLGFINLKKFRRETWKEWYSTYVYAHISRCSVLVYSFTSWSVVSWWKKTSTPLRVTYLNYSMNNCRLTVEPIKHYNPLPKKLNHLTNQNEPCMCLHRYIRLA